MPLRGGLGESIRQFLATTAEHRERDDRVSFGINHGVFPSLSERNERIEVGPQRFIVVLRKSTSLNVVDPFLHKPMQFVFTFTELINGGIERGSTIGIATRSDLALEELFVIW